MAYNNYHKIKAVPEYVYTWMKRIMPQCKLDIAKCNSDVGSEANDVCEHAHGGYCHYFVQWYSQHSTRSMYDMRKSSSDTPDFSHLEKFFNADKTKNALHVNKDSPVWKACNDDHQVYDKFYADMIKDFAPYVADFLNDGIPTLIYAGDYEFICNYLGNRAWTLNWIETTIRSSMLPRRRSGTTVQDWSGLPMDLHSCRSMMPGIWFLLTNLRLRSP